jgi:acetyl-CoA C-acetyltransferase
LAQRAAVRVAGGGIARFGNFRDGSHWRDRVHGVAFEALAEAGLEAGDIDALVVANESDAVSLQVNPAAVVASDLGLACGAMRVEGGGASGALALRAGVLHVLSGLASRVLVIGFDDAASRLSGAQMRQLYGLSFDTDVEGLAGANASVMYALSMQLHMQRHGTTREQMAAVAVKNRRHAQGNPLAHKPMAITVAEVLAAPMVARPYGLLDCSLLSDGAAAIVLAAPSALPLSPARDGRQVHIVGSGAASDAARLGERAEPEAFAAKQAAADAAYRMAGLGDPAREIGLAEVYDAYSGAELQALEALRLASPGRAGAAAAAGEFDAGGRLPVNLSGGLLAQGGSPGATGIAQAVTMARLLWGRYHAALQPANPPRRGVIDAHGGVGTLCAVHVLEARDA